MEPVNDGRYKRRAVIEFPVAEKESVGIIHKRLCYVYGSATVYRSTVGRWRNDRQLPEQEKQNPVIRALRNWLREEKAYTRLLLVGARPWKWTETVWKNGV
jgi:hypothetical protein